jgi:ribose transport system permease protein
MALMASNASTISVAQGLGPLSWLNGSSLGVPNDFILGLVVVGFGWAMMRWLPIGRSVLAIGNAERAAVVAGVSATQVRVFVFAASGVSAGLAALVLVAQQQSGAPTMADPLFLPTIAAVVVGGTAITGGSGGLAHTVVGAMIITVLRVGMSIMGISPLYQQIVYGVFLIFAIAVTWPWFTVWGAGHTRRRHIR